MRRYAFGLLLCSILMDSCNPSERFDLVQVHFENENIYIKKINWGINGDAQKTAISTSRKNSFDKCNSDYTYDGLTELFYGTSGDTLLVYVREEFKQPKEWNSNILVKQIILENPEFMGLYDEENKCIDQVNCVERF